MEIMVTEIADAEILARVEIAGKKASIRGIVSKAEMDMESRVYPWHTWFRGESLQTSKPPRVAFKAKIDDKIMGYIAGHLTIRYNVDAEIQSFYVLKEYQLQGAGTLLFRRSLKS